MVHMGYMGYIAVIWGHTGVILGVTGFILGLCGGLLRSGRGDFINISEIIPMELESIVCMKKGVSVCQRAQNVRSGKF